MSNFTKVTIVLAEDEEFTLWNEVELKSEDANQLKQDIHKKLIKHGSQIKGLVITCSGCLEDSFNLDSDEFEDNGVQEKVKASEEDLAIVPSPLPELSEEELLARTLWTISETRRKLYVTTTDPLFNKGLVLSAQGKNEEAILLQEEALTLRGQIQQQHPYPDEVVADV